MRVPARDARHMIGAVENDRQEAMQMSVQPKHAKQIPTSAQTNPGTLLFQLKDINDTVELSKS